MAFTSTKPITTRERKPRLTDEVEVFDFTQNPNEWIAVRYLGPYNSYAQGWLTIKLKNPQKGRKTVPIPKVCLDYNPKTQTFDKEICPYRKAGIYMPQRYIANMIVRDLQDDKPRRAKPPTRKEREPRRLLDDKTRWHIKDKNSRSWTPVRVHEMPATVAAKLAALSELNTVRRNGKKRAYDITDLDYGMDVNIRYNPDAAGTAKWEVQRGERTKLSREEREYLIWDLENLKSIAPEKRREAEAEWERIEPVWVPDKKRGGKNDRSRRERDKDRDADSRRRSRRRRDRDRPRRDKEISTQRNRRRVRDRAADNSRQRNRADSRQRRRRNSRDLENLDNFD